MDIDTVSDGILGTPILFPQSYIQYLLITNLTLADQVVPELPTANL